MVVQFLEVGVKNAHNTNEDPFSQQIFQSFSFHCYSQHHQITKRMHAYEQSVSEARNGVQLTTQGGYNDDQNQENKLVIRLNRFVFYKKSDKK